MYTFIEDKEYTTFLYLINHNLYYRIFSSSLQKEGKPILLGTHIDEYTCSYSYTNENSSEDMEEQNQKTIFIIYRTSEGKLYSLEMKQNRVIKTSFPPLESDISHPHGFKCISFMENPLFFFFGQHSVTSNSALYFLHVNNQYETTELLEVSTPWEHYELFQIDSILYLLFPHKHEHYDLHMYTYNLHTNQWNFRQLLLESPHPITSCKVCYISKTLHIVYTIKKEHNFQVYYSTYIVNSHIRNSLSLPYSFQKKEDDKLIYTTTIHIIPTISSFEDLLWINWAEGDFRKGCFRFLGLHEMSDVFITSKEESILIHYIHNQKQLNGHYFYASISSTVSIDILRDFDPNILRLTNIPSIHDNELLLQILALVKKEY